MTKLSHHIVIWQEGEYYVSRVLENDISSFGTSYDECVTHTQQALDLYYEDNASGIEISSTLQLINPTLITMDYAYAS